VGGAGGDGVECVDCLKGDNENQTDVYIHGIMVLGEFVVESLGKEWKWDGGGMKRRYTCSCCIFWVMGIEVGV
jgi:hypothetical protein